MNGASSGGPPGRIRRWSVVDASVWVGRFVVADVHHASSDLWLRQQLGAGQRIVAPTLLLVEVAGAVARRTGDIARSRRIVELLRELPGLSWIALGGELRDHAANLAVELRLRVADAVYLALAERLRVPLVTWDAEQLARTRPPIVAYSPPIMTW